MADARARLRRLLGLLPRVIAEQPAQGTVGVLVRLMAQSLAALDEALERTQRDHWIALARAETPADEAMAVLERLGPRLGVQKIDGEPREAYRLRLMRADRLLWAEAGKAQAVFAQAWQDAVAQLVGEARDRLAAELSALPDGDREGEALALRDQGLRLSGMDPVLRDAAEALTLEPALARAAQPQAAAERWQTLLVRHWTPVLQRHWDLLALDPDARPTGADALGRLGALLGVARMGRRHSRAVADGRAESFEVREEMEAFRRRITQTARVLGQGLTNPQGLLDLALVSLGTQPCARRTLDRDTLIARGVAPGVGAACAVCRGTAAAGADCPNAARWLVEARITDNPLRRCSWSPPTALRPGDPAFHVDSASLVTAVPELRLKALDARVSYPFVQNRDTGEIMLYAGDLEPGEVLSVWPQVEPQEQAVFDSHEAVNAYAWQAQYPSGSAMVVRPDGSLRDVSERICFLTGTRFPDADVDPEDATAPRYAAEGATEGVRFADALNQGQMFDGDTAVFGGTDGSTGARFGSSGQRVRTPRLRPGRDAWLYGVYTRDEVRAIVGNHPGDLLEQAPLAVLPNRAALELAWWVRPPAVFRLSIPKNAWVLQADERGALDLVARLVDKARAAGVTALVDFPEPPWREVHAMADSLRIELRLAQRESQPLGAAAPAWRGQVALRETQRLGEAAPVFGGVHDATRFDASLFN
jgi:hypothetical protein